MSQKKSEARKIIFVNRFFFPDRSATAQLLSDLAFHIADRNIHVVVITTSGLYESSEFELPGRELIKGVDVFRVYRPRFGRDRLLGRAVDYLAMHLAFVISVFRHSRDGDVVVAKTDPPMLSISLLPVVFLKKIKLINWLQDIYPEVAVATGNPFARMAAVLLSPLRDLSLRCAYRNIAVGESSRSFILKLGVASDKVGVIPNWCDDEKVRPLCHKLNSLRTEWGLQGKFVVAYSGNLGRAHEFHTILNAAKRLQRLHGPIFLFIGGGALQPQLTAEVREHKLESIFRFEPYQPKDSLPLSLTLPDVHWISLRPEMESWVLPSKFYGACAAGRALVFIGDGENELAQLIKAYECGVVIAPGEDKKLADFLLEMMENPKKAASMGERARNMLEKRFSKKFALEAWTNLLEPVIRETN
jgi:colanic acid biosynthesis glycosyl transferase WcaI